MPESVRLKLNRLLTRARTIRYLAGMMARNSKLVMIFVSF